jgi:hypothetical protein
VSADLAPPSSRSPSVPAAFDTVVLRAMHRDPHRRFASVEALGEALLPFASPPVAEQWRGVFARLRGSGASEAGRSARTPVTSPHRDAPRPVPVAAEACPPSPPDDRRLATRDGVAIVTRGDLMAMVWKTAARLHRTRWVFDVMDSLAASRPGGIVVLMVILPTADPPDKEARAENDRRIKGLGPSVRALSTVILGDGVRQVLIRSVMRAMVIPHRRSVRESTLDSTVDGGIERLLCAASPETPSFEQVAADVRAMHLALEVPVPPERVPHGAASVASGSAGDARSVRQSA